MSDRELPELLCRVDFPLYAATMISPRHLLLAGGGGAANTGVKNGFEIFEITHNGEQSLGKSVTRYVSGDYSIMSISARPCGNNNNTAPPKILAAAGHNEFCQVYSLSLARDRPSSEGPPSGGLRHRQTNGSPGRTQEQASTGAGQDTETKLVYRTQPLKKVQSDFAEQEPFVKVLRISLNGKLLATGGDDGHLRVWSFPEMNKVHDFPEHEKEIDDIDFSPDSAKVASISKDKRAIIWDVKKGKKHAELGWDPPGGIKYLFKRVKFACVEGDHKKYKVFTITNPMGSTKAHPLLQRWGTQSYTVEGSISSGPGNTLSALAVSDNGTFVATGTMSEGIIDIYTAYNLNKVKTVKNAHAYFITALEFLPTGEESAPCRGFSEASLVSVSVDHLVCMHHIPPLSTVSPFVAMVMIVLVLLATFIFCSWLGL